MSQTEPRSSKSPPAPAADPRSNHAEDPAPESALEAAPEACVWLNGQQVPLDQATISVFDHGLLYGDGVFEGIRVYNHRVFKLATHLRRLYESAQAIRLEIPYTPDQLAQAVRDTAAATGRPDGYIRLCVTRGVGALGLHPFTCDAPSVFIIAGAIKLYPQELYQRGMKVITASTIRNHPGALSPRIKSMNYLNNILAKIEAIDAGVLEAVMLNHLGLVTECTGDNIFIVQQRDGQPVLLTPPPHAGVLEGVTLTLVLGLAREAGIATARLDLSRHDLYTASEMFLTGTAAEVIPVTRVDNRPIGAGEPGPITTRLGRAFREMVRKDAPED